MATRERSAGVIVFHREPEPSFLLLDYGKHWDFPKGHLEKNEDDLTAALRELEEETGIKKVELADGFAKEIVYFFRHPRRGLTRKKVIFYLAAVKQKKITISHEHVGYEFLPFDEALNRLTYPTAKQLLRDANDYLQKHDV
ncbi:MAG TPA: NUDIX domain-containing protein [Tepidisphaeraceae bacterium]|nr:NUDIX domain-containing protein [Tepidisphaeraceae bacterium]